MNRAGARQTMWLLLLRLLPPPLHLHQLHLFLLAHLSPSVLSPYSYAAPSTHHWVACKALMWKTVCPRSGAVISHLRTLLLLLLLRVRVAVSRVLSST